MERGSQGVLIYCGGKRTLAVLTRFGWRCSCCGEPVKVVAPDSTAAPPLLDGFGVWRAVVEA